MNKLTPEQEQNLSPNAADFLRMYKSLTDPEEIEKAKRLAARKARREERMRDTGAYVV